jgi:hypothetical protein
METKGEKTMNKWGVRLIACLFFIRAISDIYELIANTGSAEGSSLGWRVIIGGANLSSFMAWVEIIILVFAGVQLLRFQPSGRYWALFTLWISTLVSGVFLIRMIVGVTKAFYQHEPIEAYFTISFGDTVGNKVEGVIPLLLLFVGAFVFYLVPVYFLMRKDVKQLFEKPVAVEGTTNIIQGEKS